MRGDGAPQAKAPGGVQGPPPPERDDDSDDPNACGRPGAEPGSGGACGRPAGARGGADAAGERDGGVDPGNRQRRRRTRARRRDGVGPRRHEHGRDDRCPRPVRDARAATGRLHPARPPDRLCGLRPRDGRAPAQWPPGQGLPAALARGRPVRRDVDAVGAHRRLRRPAAADVDRPGRGRLRRGRPFPHADGVAAAARQPFGAARRQWHARRLLRRERRVHTRRHPDGELVGLGR